MNQQQHTDSRQKQALTGAIMAALGSAALLGPLSTDMHLPAFPNIADDFGVSGATVQLTVATCVIAQALGQFFLGALSDLVGRKLVLVGGTFVMTVASFVAALSPNILTLIWLFAAMGFAVAGGIASGRAVIADLTSGPSSTRPFTILWMLLSVGPIIAPVAGALVLSFFDWRAIFIAMGIAGALSTLALFFFVPETLTREERNGGSLGKTLRTVGTVLKDKQFLLFAGVLWMGFALMFGWISSSSLILQGELGFDPSVNALVFAVISGMLLVFSLLTARLSSRIPPKRLITIGIALESLGVILLLVLLLTGMTTPWLVILVLLLFGSPMGFVFGPATALAMENLRFAAGTASAVLGSFQLMMGGIATLILSLLGGNPLIGLSIIGVVAMAIAWIALAVAKRVPQQ